MRAAGARAACRLCVPVVPNRCCGAGLAFTSVQSSLWMVDALVWSLSVAVNALICSAVTDVTSCIQVIYIEHSRAETQTWVPMRTWWLLSFYAAALVLCVHNAIVCAHISIILLLRCGHHYPCLRHHFNFAPAACCDCCVAAISGWPTAPPSKPCSSPTCSSSSSTSQCCSSPFYLTTAATSNVPPSSSAAFLWTQ